MRRPPLPAARTFNTAPRFSVPNFGMRTNAPNTRLGRRSFHESHPGDTTFSFLFLLFLLFFFAKKKKKKREEESLCRTLCGIKVSERRVIIEAFHLISIARGYDMEREERDVELLWERSICFFVARHRRNRRYYTVGK